MFSVSAYAEVNREERHYCALLMHALLASEQFRTAFCTLCDARCKSSLDPENLEVYVEVAALRDFWRDLGDPVEYSEETHARRRSVVSAVLDRLEVARAEIEQHDLFWTSPDRTKLRYPGRWPPEAVRDAGLDRLKKARWAFNAKPDLLLLSPESGVLVEAKVDSGVGTYEPGHDQLATQRLVATLMLAPVPAFDDVGLVQAVLANTDAADLTWTDVADSAAVSDLDSFTATSLAVAAGR